MPSGQVCRKLQLPHLQLPPTQASRLGIQDGVDAGQSVPHVHVLWRKTPQDRHMKMIEPTKSVWVVGGLLSLLLRAHRFWSVSPVPCLLFSFVRKLCCPFVGFTSHFLATVDRLPPHSAMRFTSCRSLGEKERCDRLEKKSGLCSAQGSWLEATFTHRFGFR